MAVSLGGSTYLSRSGVLRGVENSKKALFSCWLKVASGNSGVVIVGGTSGTGNIFYVTVGSGTGLVTVVLKDASETIMWQVTGDTDITDSVWHHLAVSVDSTTGTARGQVYIDRAAETLTTATALTADAKIGFAASTNWVVGAYFSGVTPVTAEVGDIILWAGQSIDLSTATNLATLVSSDGLTESDTYEYRQDVGPSPSYKPVGYGHDCSIPTGGTRPDIYFGGNFGFNRGTGGVFGLTGTLASSRGPNIYRNSALAGAKPGERWFQSEQSGWVFPRSQTIIERREGISSAGQRIGLSEVDDETRDENPGQTFQSLVLGIDEEEDIREDDR
jgi:hypothetical protein